MAEQDLVGAALVAIAATLDSMAETQRMLVHAIDHLADAHVAQTESHAALATVVNAQQKEGSRTADHLQDLVRGIRGTQALMIAKQREGEQRLKEMKQQLADRIAGKQ